MLGVSPTLVRALIPKGDPNAGHVVAEGDLHDRRAVEPRPVPAGSSSKVGGGTTPIVNCSGGTEVGACFLTTCVTEPIKPVALGFPALGQDMDVFDADGTPVRGEVGELVCKRPWPGMTRGIWGDDERYLDAVLAPLPGRLDARRLGVGRRGRLLVPARPLRRHAQHRRQAHRAGGARVGGGRAPRRRRSGGDRRPARRQGRGRVDLLRAEARRRSDARAARSRSRRGDRRARQGVQARADRVRLGAAEDAQRQDRAPRRAGPRPRARIQAISPSLENPEALDEIVAQSAGLVYASRRIRVRNTNLNVRFRAGRRRIVRANGHLVRPTASWESPRPSPRSCLAWPRQHGAVPQDPDSLGAGSRGVSHARAQRLPPETRTRDSRRCTAASTSCAARYRPQRRAGQRPAQPFVDAESERGAPLRLHAHAVRNDRSTRTFRRAGYLPGPRVRRRTSPGVRRRLGSPVHTLQLWLNSPPHRENLLGSDAGEISGSPYERGHMFGRDGVALWVMQFGRRHGSFRLRVANS